MFEQLTKKFLIRFDTVDFQIMEKKLKSFNFSQDAIKWARSYLHGRTQQIKVDDKLSRKTLVNSGVPQGSILGPILFVIYVGDLEKQLHEKTSLFSYADDTVISVSGSRPEEIAKSLQYEANIFFDYCGENGLVANPSKTKFLLFRAKGKGNAEQQKIKVEVNGTKIEESRSEKVLGVTINNKLM